MEKVLKNINFDDRTTKMAILGLASYGLLKVASFVTNTLRVFLKYAIYPRKNLV